MNPRAIGVCLEKCTKAGCKNNRRAVCVYCNGFECQTLNLSNRSRVSAGSAAAAKFMQARKLFPYASGRRQSRLVVAKVPTYINNATKPDSQPAASAITVTIIFGAAAVACYTCSVFSMRAHPVRWVETGEPSSGVSKLAARGSTCSKAIRSMRKSSRCIMYVHRIKALLIAP